MIAEEELHPEQEPNHSIEEGTYAKQIVESLHLIPPAFVRHILPLGDLNEEELTQEFVVLLDRRLRLKNYPFCVQKEYRDIHNGSTGRSDFYFFSSEEGKSTASIFSVEAKRLPAPTIDREKEYVRDERINRRNHTRRQGGGIERYKIGTHGKTLLQCGMVAYIEEETVIYWREKINDWIVALALNGTAEWNHNEILSEFLMLNEEYAYLKSIVNRRLTEDTLSLHHIWIKIH